MKLQLTQKTTRLFKSTIIKALFFTFIFTTTPFITYAEDFISRGAATDLIVKSFDLENSNKEFLNQCDKDIDLCLFSFSTRTHFNIYLDPVILYPDVFPAYKYYKSINLATKLDLVSGYFNDENSPFRPEQQISKIEALKLIFGAAQIMSWKEKIELDEDDMLTPSNPLTPIQFMTEKWWYLRYIMKAMEWGIINKNDISKIENGLTKEELIIFIDKTKEMSKISII